MSKFEMLKKLEHLVSFQSICLASGDWESFDRTDNEVKMLENKILQTSEGN